MTHRINENVKNEQIVKANVLTTQKPGSTEATYQLSQKGPPQKKLYISSVLE